MSQALNTAVPAVEGGVFTPRPQDPDVDFLLGVFAPRPEDLDVDFLLRADAPARRPDDAETAAFNLEAGTIHSFAQVMEARRHAQTLGVPLDDALRHPREAKRLAARIDPETLRRMSPRLLRALADGETARYAHGEDLSRLNDVAVAFESAFPTGCERNAPEGPGLSQYRPGALERVGIRLREGTRQVGDSLHGALLGLVEGFARISRKEAEANVRLANKIDDDPVQQFVEGLAARLREADAERRRRRPARLPDADDALQRYAEDFITSAPQFLSQIGAYLLTGPAGGMAMMGAQIGGSTYNDLTAEGVAPDIALEKALLNSALQAPLEKIGWDKALAVFKARGVWDVLKRVGGASATEFITETLQNYPDALTRLWGKHEQRGKGLEAAWRDFSTDFWNITRQGMYEGLIAAPWGALFGGARLATRGGRGAALPENATLPETATPDLREFRDISETAARLADDAASMEQRARLGESLDAAARAADATDLKGAAPDALREVLEELLPEQGGELWIDPRDALRLHRDAVERGEDHAVTKALNTTPEALADAAETGTPLPLSVADVLSGAPGAAREGLLDLARATPGGPSGPEARAFDPARRAEQALARVREARRAHAAVEQQEQRLRREMEAAGVPAHVAAVNAALHGAQARAFAAAYGVDPVRLLERRGVTRGTAEDGAPRQTDTGEGKQLLGDRFAAMSMLEADSSQWFGPGKAIDADGPKMRGAVQDWTRTAFPQGTTVTNADTGWDIRISPRGIRNTLAHGGDDTLARSVPFIPQIIEGGIHLASMEKKQGLISHIFANKIRLDGQDYVVGFVLREDRTGNRFYDHELTEIINPDSLNAGAFSSEEGVALAARANRGDVMNILREKLGVNDGSGQILFHGHGEHSAPRGAAHQLGEAETFPAEPLVREGIVRKPDSETARVVGIEADAVPEFSGMKDFAHWLKNMLAEGGNVLINSTGQEARFSSGNVKASAKRSRSREHRNAYAALREMVANAEYDHYERPDARHPDRGGQDVYHSALAMGGKLYSVKLKLDVVFEREKTNEQVEDVRYKDHRLAEIEIAPALLSRYAQIGDPKQSADAISAVTLGVLRGGVKPSGIEGGTLYQTGGEQPAPRGAPHQLGEAETFPAEPLAGEERDIAPALYRGRPETGETAQPTDAISGVTLGVPRGGVKPSGIEGGTLRQGEDNAETVSRFQPSREEVDAADAALRRDADAWGKAVDGVYETLAATGKLPSRPVKMLGQTPLVLRMLGKDALTGTIASGNGIYAAPHFFDATHPNITPDMRKQIPAAMADPIAIFDTSQDAGRKKGDVVFMLDLKDGNGATVVVPVALRATKAHGVIINMAKSVYAKERGNKPDNAWFVKQAQKNARYIHRQKMKRWSRVVGADLPFERTANASGNIVFTDADLVKLRQAHPEFYQSGKSGLPTPPLMVTHNLSAGHLAEVLRLGGLPSPSLGITRADAPHTGFGDITLIGPKDLADPQASPVLSRDAWSPSAPRVSNGEHATAPTLEQALERMLSPASRRRRGAYGTGRLLADTATRFKTMDELKAARGQLTDSQRAQAQRDYLDSLLDPYALEAARRYGRNPHISQAARESAAMRALKDAYAAGGTREALTAALEKSGFDPLSAQALDDGVKALAEMRTLLTEYFEAKPQRALTLDEFSGAVAPRGTDPALLKGLRDAGLKVREYVPGEDAQQQAATALAEELHREQENVLFQKRAPVKADGGELGKRSGSTPLPGNSKPGVREPLRQNASAPVIENVRPDGGGVNPHILPRTGASAAARGSVHLSPGRAAIRLFSDADLSTLPHEAAHIFLDDLLRVADDYGGMPPDALNRSLAGIRDTMPASARERLDALLGPLTRAAHTSSGMETARDRLFFQSERGDVEENITRGREAMERVITQQTDVLNAMFRPEAGGISFYWGTPGQGKKLKKGSGIAHLIARRNSEGEDGAAIARAMVDVLAYGRISKEQKAEGGDRIFISYEGHTAVLSLYRFGNRETWLLTGWKDDASDAISKEYDSDTATHNGSTRFQSVMGAEAETILPPLGADGKPLFQAHAARADAPAPAQVQEIRSRLRDARRQAGNALKAAETALHAARQAGDDPGIAEAEAAMRDARGEANAYRRAERILERHQEHLRGLERARADIRALRRWCSLPEDGELTDAQTTHLHERTAEGFEQYLGEGRAPSAELAGVFARMKEWLKKVYLSARDHFKLPINDDVRRVFDRMLATDAQMEGNARVRDALRGEDAFLRLLERRSVMRGGEDNAETVSRFQPTREEVDAADAAPRGESRTYHQPLNEDVDPDALLSVVQVTPTLTGEAWRYGKGEEKKRLLSTFPYGIYTNRDTGWNIEIGKLGVRHSLATALTKTGNDLGAFEAILHLPELVEHAVLVETHPDVKGQEGLRQVHRMYAPMLLGETLYAVKLTIKEYEGQRLAELEGVQKFYDAAVVKKGALPTSISQSETEMLLSRHLGTVRHQTAESRRWGVSAPDAAAFTTLRQLLEGVNDYRDEPFFP